MMQRDEVAYLARFEARLLRQMMLPVRFSLLVGAALFLAFFVWEWTSAPEHLAWTMPLRVLTALLLGALHVASYGRLRRRPDLLLYAGLMVSTTTVMVLGSRLPDGHLFVVGSVLLLVLFLGVIATSVRVAVIGSVLMFALVTCGAWLCGATAREFFTLNLFFLPGLVVSGVFSSLTWRTRLAGFKLELALESQAHHDALTEVLTRRAFTSLAESRLRRAELAREPMSVLQLDLDHFKRINDEHGHVVGDQALKVLGAVLRRELRDGDLIGRLGGEEFAVLLHGLDPAEAGLVAERLRHAISLAPVQWNGVEVMMTASLGLTQVSRGEALEAALHRADLALYEAKRAGRNRVRLAEARACDADSRITPLPRSAHA